MNLNETRKTLETFLEDYRIKQTRGDMVGHFKQEHKPKPEEHPLSSLVTNISIMAANDYLDLKAILYGVYLNKIDFKSWRFRQWVYRYTTDESIIKRTGNARLDQVVYVMSSEDVLKKCVQEVEDIKEYFFSDPYEIFSSMDPGDFIKLLDDDFERNKNKYLKEILTGKTRDKHFLL